MSGSPIPEPKVALDEDVRLGGAPNFRDLGGYPTADGRRTRWRQLYRSEALHQLTEADVSALTQLGLRLVCDFRSEHEREVSPNPWLAAHAARELHIDLATDVRSENRHMIELLRDDPTRAGARAMMVECYRQFPGNFVGHLGRLVDALCAGDLPAIIHCTAGKDRTGFASAMLLLALGVERDIVYQDFLLTNKRTHVAKMNEVVAPMMSRLVGAPLSDEAMDVINGVLPEYLDASLETIAREYGSLDGYLEKAGGLGEVEKKRLQELLLE